MKKTNISVITFPLVEAGFVPLNNLINILKPISDRVNVITGLIISDDYTENKKKARNKLKEILDTNKENSNHIIEYSASNNIIFRCVKYFWTQVKITYLILKSSKVNDILFFFIGGEGLLIPMLVAKLTNRKIILLLAGFSPHVDKDENNLLKKALLFLVNKTCAVADYIFLYGFNLVYEWNLGKYEKKIKIAGEHYINTDIFKIINTYSNRKHIIGYIGRLSEEKGINNFVEAIPITMKSNNKLSYVIGGNGRLYTSIEKKIRTYNLSKRVELLGWINREEIVDYLNDFRLIVIPSYTEGLPNIMLEAMACGVPVLAAPVGVIPNVIKNGETGFILEENSAECIAESVLNISSLPDSKLERISKKARAFIEREFTFNKTVEKWGELLRNL
jgi:glycosyltransferase involved in cell wall biosynthesis